MACAVFITGLILVHHAEIVIGLKIRITCAFTLYFQQMLTLHRPIQLSTSHYTVLHNKHNMRKRVSNVQTK